MSLFKKRAKPISSREIQMAARQSDYQIGFVIEDLKRHANEVENLGKTYLQAGDAEKANRYANNYATTMKKMDSLMTKKNTYSGVAFAAAAAGLREEVNLAKYDAKIKNWLRQEIAHQDKLPEAEAEKIEELLNQFQRADATHEYATQSTVGSQLTVEGKDVMSQWSEEIRQKNSEAKQAEEQLQQEIVNREKAATSA